jgi:divalent metal cation (Fe/Co/Zn/Cd) transporter
MQARSIVFVPDRDRLIVQASALALITIFYNIAEGLISIFFGLGDESMSLFGFGLDSFVEVVSGIGIWHMIRRVRRNGGEHLDRFEQRALRITGTAFYVLTLGLAITSMMDLVRGHRPVSTFWGTVISLVSIVSMWALIRAKVSVGTKLNSQAILADAACTRVCLQLSVVLLIASVGFTLTNVGGLDSIGALVIGGLCFREGKEAFEKARAGNFSCACEGSCKAN